MTNNIIDFLATYITLFPLELFKLNNPNYLFYYFII